MISTRIKLFSIISVCVYVLYLSAVNQISLCPFLFASVAGMHTKRDDSDEKKTESEMTMRKTHK